jgi:biopolymer transport protein ExbB/TolQ
MSPILWGLGAAFLFYIPIHSGQWSHPMVVRYFTGHWVEYVTAGLFFIGVAAIAIKAFGVWSQFHLQHRPLLDAVPAGGQPVADCEVLLKRLDEQPAAIQDSYLIRRLREALEYVYRKASADTLDDELRYLADLDVSRIQSGYAFLRIVIWAIPILGFLGTVIGITEAVAGLSPQALEESLPTVTAGLGVAFDTTALSLALSMVLMFGLYIAERFESNLVDGVDARVAAELVGRFQSSGEQAAEPQVAILRRISEQMMHSVDQLVTRQADLWKASFTEAQKQWGNWSAGSTKQLQDALQTSLVISLKEHAATLAAGNQSAMGHWAEVQKALLQNAEAVTLQQRELVRQGEVLQQVISATGQVEKLETELNRNLNTLAGAKNFEQTVLSLGAAIQLLNARLGQAPPPEAPQVELKAKRSGKAA